MAISLVKGQRVSLDNTMKLALVGLGWDTNRYDGGYDFDLDASAFLLGANGKLQRDEDFIFYNNLESRNKAVVHTGDNLTGDGDGDDEVIMIDFTKIPSDIQKIAICVTIHDAVARGQNLVRFQTHISGSLRCLMNLILLVSRYLSLILRRNSQSRPRSLLRKFISKTESGNSMQLQPVIKADWKRLFALTVATYN